VAVGVSHFTESITVPSFPLVLSEKRLLGCVYGSAQVRRDFPRLVGFVENGRLDLANMITRTLPLDDINEAFRAMTAGEVVRSVIV
jgi:S-(hydroxymethyl)glutathione dehydrogenase/alcohol dehydrogenase